MPRYVQQEQDAIAQEIARKEEEAKIKEKNSFFPDEQGPLEKQRGGKEREVEGFLDDFSKT